MDYSTLISKFAANETLFKSAMSEIPTDSSYLNLLTEDWEAQLENNAFYQDFCTKSKSLWKSPYKNEFLEYAESKISNFNVIVIGNCKFVKSFKGKPCKQGIFVFNCDPLNKIARAMTSDLDPSINLSNEYKFNFMQCSRLTCDLCYEGAEAFIKSGYTVDPINQPCISDTKVFDGKRIVNRFSSQMQSMFSQTFLAIMFLQINSRYSYINNNHTEHRISGNILNIIGFNEAKLMFNKKIEIGDLVISASPEKMPEETDFVTQMMEDAKKQSDPLEKLQKETHFLTKSMLENNEQSLIKRSTDDAIEDEPLKKILKKNNSKEDELDFLNELMKDDSLENAQMFDINDEDKTEELLLI